MSRNDHSHHHVCALRPLRRYEPAAARRRGAECADQLTLPLHIGASVETKCAACARTPARPSPHYLRRLLRALVEVLAGRRPLAPLRARLSGELYQQFSGKAAPPLGRRFVVRSMRTGTDRPGAVELCATIYDPASQRLHSVAACLEAHWSGWRFTAFDIVGATSTRTRAEHPA